MLIFGVLKMPCVCSYNVATPLQSNFTFVAKSGQFPESPAYFVKKKKKKFTRNILSQKVTF